MPRRRRQWIDTVVDEDMATTVTNAKQLIPAGFSDETKGLTIVRLILGLDLHGLIPTTTGNNRGMLSAGIGILSDEAVAGGAAIPLPGNEVQEPVTGWLWRQQYQVMENFTGGLPRIELDLRAMRKLMYGSPQLILTNTPVSGTAFTLTVRGIVRMLVLQS